MQQAQGNKRRAARELGVSRETLERRLRENSGDEGVRIRLHPGIGYNAIRRLSGVPGGTMDVFNELGHAVHGRWRRVRLR